MEDHLVAPSPNGHNDRTANNTAPASSNSTSTIPSNAKKRKKTIPHHIISTSSLVSHSDNCSTASTPAITRSFNELQDQPLKRKRGRPPKNSKHHPIQQRSLSIQPQCAENDTIEEGNEPESYGSKSHHLQSNQVKGGSRADNSASSLIPRRVPSSRSVPSLHELVSRFEVQYQEMGQRYTEMGTLMDQIKIAIDDRRTQSEQEIRRELIDEIRRNLLEGIPKR